LSGLALAMTGASGSSSLVAGRGNRPRRCEATCQEVIVSQVRVHNFSVSLDGFGTGEGQSLAAPFGHAGTRLHEWFFPTRAFRAMHGERGGSTGIDNAFASAWAPGIGGEIMGRGKFGPPDGPLPGPGGERGRTRSGPEGGEPPRRSTPRSSSSPTIPGHPSRWTAVPPFTSSTPAPPRRLPRRARPPPEQISASAAARPPSASSWPP